MPLDNWDDKGFFEDPLYTLLNLKNSPAKKKKVAKTKAATAIKQPAAPDLGNEDDWFAEPNRSATAVSARHCREPVDVAALCQLSDVDPSNSRDVAHLSNCPQCMARYEAEKRRVAF